MTSRRCLRCYRLCPEAIRLAKLRLHHVDPNEHEVADVEPPRARQESLFGGDNG